MKKFYLTSLLACLGVSALLPATAHAQDGNLAFLIFLILLGSTVAILIITPICLIYDAYLHRIASKRNFDFRPSIWTFVLSFPIVCICLIFLFLLIQEFNRSYKDESTNPAVFISLPFICLILLVVFCWSLYRDIKGVRAEKAKLRPKQLGTIKLR
jgi:uncharacterized membrane protein